MKTDLAKRLVALRETTGLGSIKFANAIDWKPSSYQHYETKYKKSHLPPDLVNSLLAAADKLGMDKAEIRTLGTPAINAPETAPASSAFKGADLPILGRVMGGVGVFVDNGGSLGEAMRPMTLMGIRDAYAVYIDGSSMEPRYYEGELAMVHPLKPISRGSFVIVQYDEDETRHYTIKRYVKRSGGVLYLEQLNPSEMWELDMNKVHTIHRVVGAIDT